VGSPYRLCLGVCSQSSAAALRLTTWGLCPQTPRIYRFAATGTRGGIGLLPRRIGLRWEPSHSATLRPGPSAVAEPYGTGGALRGAAWFGCAGGPKAINPRGSGGLVPQGLRPNILGAPTGNPEEPTSVESCSTAARGPAPRNPEAGRGQSPQRRVERGAVRGPARARKRGFHTCTSVESSSTAARGPAPRNPDARRGQPP